MNIEIVEFYEIDRNDEREMLTGTLRIRLPDIGIEILGIYVSKKKERWFFSLPMRVGRDNKTGEAVRYPCLVFTDPAKHKSLIEAIRREAIPFIEKLFNFNENNSLSVKL